MFLLQMKMGRICLIMYYLLHYLYLVHRYLHILMEHIGVPFQATLWLAKINLGFLNGHIILVLEIQL